MALLHLRRTFHAVGHGAFYTERFLTPDAKCVFTAVYDCGSRASTKIIQEVDRTFSINKKIDVVFISHFHADHINGLEHLLGQYDVETVVLPVITAMQKLELVGAHSGALSLFEIELIADPVSAIRKCSPSSLVALVTPDNEDKQAQEAQEPQDLHELGGRNQQDSVTIASGQPLKTSKLRDHTSTQWLYVPYNPKGVGDEILTGSNISDLLIKYGVDINSPDSIQHNVNKIKGIYKEYFGTGNKLNTTSMTLYSGYAIACFYGCCSCCDCHPNACCMYMGDISVGKDKDWSKFHDAYGSLWDQVALVQVPHHGSLPNYNPLINTPPRTNIISAKPDTTHPDPKTVEHINDSGACLIMNTLANEVVFTYPIRRRCDY